MKNLARRALLNLAKVTQPHLSRIIGANRPQNIDWRLDPNPRPKRLPFDESQRGISPGISDLNPITYTDVRRPFRILALDGGGVRGILTLALLIRIVERDPTFLDQVDLIAGTSAGGILALLLASGYTPKECGEIYSYAAPHIFGHQPWRVINPWRAKYSDKNKEDIMKYYFRNRSMIDLKKSCTVVAFRLDGRKSKTHSFFDREGWRPAIFSNLPKGNSCVEPDADVKVWDAAMRTSAAPTFFPVFRGYTDGGIVANNPSIVAVSKAIAHFPNVSSRNVSVLSLGAGSYPRHTNLLSAAQGTELKSSRSGKKSELWRADWGIKQWIPFLLDLLLDGDTVTTEMVMHYLLGGSNLYHRFDPQLPSQIALDDVNSMPLLQEFAQTVDMEATFKFIDENFSYDPLSAVDDGFSYNNLDQAGDYHIAWKNLAVVDDVYSKVITEDDFNSTLAQPVAGTSTSSSTSPSPAPSNGAVGGAGSRNEDRSDVPGLGPLVAMKP